MDDNANEDNKNKATKLSITFILFILSIILMLFAGHFIGESFESIHENKEKEIKSFETQIPESFVSAGIYKSHKTNRRIPSFMNVETKTGLTFQIPEIYEDVLINSEVFIRNDKEHRAACFKNESQTKCYFAFDISEKK